jgi:sugar phosphate isomerase/epimerase
MIGPRQVLWAAALRSKGLQERVSATAAAGFAYTSVFPSDMAAWHGQGQSYEGIGRVFRDAGVQVVAIDPFVQWVPDFKLEDYPAAQDQAFVAHNEQSVFAMADAVRAPLLNIVSFSRHTVDLPA